MSFQRGAFQFGAFQQRKRIQPSGGKVTSDLARLLLAPRIERELEQKIEAAAQAETPASVVALEVRQTIRQSLAQEARPAFLAHHAREWLAKYMQLLQQIEQQRRRIEEEEEGEAIAALLLVL